MIFTLIDLLSFRIHDSFHFFSPLSPLSFSIDKRKDEERDEEEKDGEKFSQFVHRGKINHEIFSLFSFPLIEPVM